jgi:hypothetical protein
MKRWGSLAVLLAVAAAACGGAKKPPGRASAVKPVTSESPAAAEPAAPGASAAAVAKSSTRKSSGRVSAPRAGLSPAVAALPPVTDTTIKVGIAYSEDPGAANAAAGFAGIGQVDQKRGWDKMIAEINKVKPFGRSVVPSYISYTTSDIQSKGADQLGQEWCQRWAADKVFMAFFGNSIPTLTSCLTQRKIAQLGGGLGFSYAKTFQENPYLVEHNSPALDRTAQFYIDQLHAQGFFSTFKTDPSSPPVPPDRKPIIGLLRYDTPAHKVAGAIIKSRLAAQGLALKHDFEVHWDPASNPANQLAEANPINTAVATCKADGCTHFLFMGSTSGVRLSIFGGQRMEDQRYRPMLGFSSWDAPAAAHSTLKASFDTPTTDYDALFRMAMLVSHSPNTFRAQTAAFAKCKALFVEAGEVFEGREANAKEGQIGGYCDTAWYFIAALNATGRTLNLDTWMGQGVATAGKVEAVGAYRMQTSAQRHDGASAIRNGKFFDDCNCFKETTDEIAV